VSIDPRVAKVSTTAGPPPPAGKKGAEGRALVIKGKPKGGKAGAGSPRGKKRGAGKCAPPAPGVHACSQCGAQVRLQACICHAITATLSLRRLPGMVPGCVLRLA
jgi:hypothetical protein